MKRLEQIRSDFVNALKALEEAVSQATTDLEVDGAIQRFEFTYELFWKLLRAHLQQQGLVVNTPKECFKEAYRLRILPDEETALKMVDDRNLTTHLYDKPKSREVFERIKLTYVRLYNEALTRMQAR
ncbi:MAG: nucleotidyltransferase [Ignavibacteria bacterium]|nr:nucleotidyltransferase [Ignavibacteria bacterium]